MNITTTQMDPRVAAIYYKDYRKKVREHRAQRLASAEKKILEGGREIRTGRTERSLIEKEDETLMLSYREMARGQRILNLAQVMRAAGVDKDPKKRLPVLAVAQADWKHVWVKTDSNRVVFSKGQWVQYDYRHNQYKEGAVAFMANSFPAELTNAHWRTQNGLPAVDGHRALVPAIPAALRPAGSLEGYHLLWEAVWEHAAPPDPLLIKRVSGHIFTVLAQWDLTPIEKMVLEGRST